MLPTYEKSNIILSGFKTLFLSPPMEVKSSDTFQNLYILSDDKPLKNDWVLCLGEIEGNKHHKVTLGDRQYISPIRQRGEKDTCLNCKKIIATTADIMLKCNDGSGFYTAPDLPTSFIQHYIEQYNIGNVITEVEVEYPIGTVILDSEYKDKVTVLSNDFTYDENIGSLHVYTTQGIKGRLTFNDVYRPKEGWSEIVTESLVGRYLKYIGTSSDKPAYGDYFRIDSMESMGLFRLKDKSSGCKWTPEEVLKGTSKDFELMPEGWTPETKETIVSKVPEYVECIKSNNKNFTVGEIYTWPRPIDNDGAKRNPGVLNGSVWTFKPSTKKEYDWQKQKGKLLLMDSIPHPDFNNFGTRRSASISDLSYNPCGEIPVIKHYSVGIDPAIMQKPLTVKESYPTKETIKTQVISTNIINIPLKSKKKKQLFTI